MKTGIGILTAAAVVAGGTFAERPYSDPDLRAISRQTYTGLIEVPNPEINPAKFAAFRREIEQRRKSRQGELEREAARLGAKASAARARLSSLNLEASRDTPDMARRRAELHCTILATERDLRVNEAMRRFGLSGSLGNDLAKVYLVEYWPRRRAHIERIIAAGRARARPHGDVEDIGIRKIDDAQKLDIRIGLEGIREMEGVGLMPPRCARPKVGDYVQALASRIAANSDLRVPVRATVLATPDIDSFALPGGFVFLTTGLISSASTEDELAGVLAHEIAHAAARHGERLTEGLSIRNVVSQGAEMAANVLTGGAAGAARKYVTQYGILGIGTGINLRLLGVDPAFEAEADQLGTQYLWRSGYDPRGFLSFFDRIASQPEALSAISFLYTHPPYPDAMLVTFSELMYLPEKAGAREDSPEFHEVQKLLAAKVSETENSAAAAGRDNLAGCPDLPLPAKGPKVN
jgi:hypothetical protein